MSLPARLLRLLVCFYQRGISPFLPVACRYHPTCSQYALEAIKRHGAAKGVWLAAKRVGRCHPWGGFGFDPVPPAGTESGAGKSESTGKIYG